MGSFSWLASAVDPKMLCREALFETGKERQTVSGPVTGLCALRSVRKGPCAPVGDIPNQQKPLSPCICVQKA